MIVRFMLLAIATAWIALLVVGCAITPSQQKWNVDIGPATVNVPQPPQPKDQPNGS